MVPGCTKKDGGIRPIAVGEILRRLTSKCAARCVADKAADILAHLQLGVGVRNGCEALVHALRAVLDERDAETYIMQVDFKNAFMSVPASPREARFNCCLVESPVRRSRPELDAAEPESGWFLVWAVLGFGGKAYPLLYARVP